MESFCGLVICVGGCFRHRFRSVPLLSTPSPLSQGEKVGGGRTKRKEVQTCVMVLHLLDFRGGDRKT